ncbi:hypothetical protein TA3x_001046 [Tundrisphaera sp. TA3]|uniref:hypothetical protein n=1 Tax=Tundrisphaera sp. TA3 TaxID=3435775 RepID=UPI003EB97B72
MHREPLTVPGPPCECWDRDDPDPQGPCGKPSVARWYCGVAPRSEGETADPVDLIPWAALVCEKHDREMQAEAQRMRG